MLHTHCTFTIFSIHTDLDTFKRQLLTSGSPCWYARTICQREKTWRTSVATWSRDGTLLCSMMSNVIKHTGTCFSSVSEIFWCLIKNCSFLFKLWLCVNLIIDFKLSPVDFYHTFFKIWFSCVIWRFAIDKAVRSGYNTALDIGTGTGILRYFNYVL